MRVLIEAKGEYARELPESLRLALAQEVQKHMEGYGLSKVSVMVFDGRESVVFFDGLETDANTLRTGVEKRSSSTADNE